MKNPISCQNQRFLFARRRSTSEKIIYQIDNIYNIHSIITIDVPSLYNRDRVGSRFEYVVYEVNNIYKIDDFITVNVTTD